MRSKKIYIKCNKCGKVNIIENLSEEFKCSNCHFPMSINESLIIKNKEKSADRLLYELENKIIIGDSYKSILSILIEKGVDNDLIKYLKCKNDNTSLSFISDSSPYKWLILKDVLKDDEFSIEKKKELISSTSITDKEMYFEILNESIFKLEKSKKLIEELKNKKIDMVFNEPKLINHNITPAKIVMGVISILLIFIFTLFFDNDLGKPISIILSLIPSIIIGVNIVVNIKIKKVYQVLVGIILCFILFYFISYILIIRYDGLINLTQHMKNIINSIPNFVNEIFERLELNEILEEVEGE